MAFFECVANNGTIRSATLTVSSPVSIKAGHVAVVSAWQSAYFGTLSTSISISGTEGVDYKVILNNNSARPEGGGGDFKTDFKGKVIKAINNITITATHSGGTNYPNGGITVYDLT